MFKRYSKCVYCGSKTFKKLKIQSFRENFYTKAIIHDLNISKNILLKMKVYQCQKCFIIQNNPWFDNDHTWRIYSNIYGQHNRNWENLLNFIKRRNIPDHGKLFKILENKLPIKNYAEFNSPFMGLMFNFLLKEKKESKKKLNNLFSLIFNYLKARQVAGMTYKLKKISERKSKQLKSKINLIKKKIFKKKGVVEKYLLIDNSPMSWGINDNLKSVNSRSYAAELLNLKILNLNDNPKKKIDLFGIFHTLDHTFEPQKILNYALNNSKYVIVYCHIDEKINKQHLFSFTKKFLKYLNSKKIHTVDLTDKIEKNYNSPELYFLCSKNNKLKNF